MQTFRFTGSYSINTHNSLKHKAISRFYLQLILYASFCAPYTDGSINTIICSSYCLFHNKNLIGMKYTDFLTEFSKEPDSEDNIYVLVSGKGQRQHVYDFEKDGLQVWVWRNRIRTVLIYNANL